MEKSKKNYQQASLWKAWNLEKSLKFEVSIQVEGVFHLTKGVFYLTEWVSHLTEGISQLKAPSIINILARIGMDWLAQKSGLP